MTNHLRLDLNLVELLAGVDTNNATNHLGDDNHVTEVSLDSVGLLVGLSLLLGLAELLDQTHGAALKTAVDPAAGTGVDDIAELVGAEVQKAKETSLLAGLSMLVTASWPVVHAKFRSPRHCRQHRCFNLPCGEKQVPIVLGLSGAIFVVVVVGSG